MPAQLISQANPQPDPSLLPDTVLDYATVVDTKDFLAPEELESILFFRRAADYIAACVYPYCHDVLRLLICIILAMIFLNDNVLLEKPLTYDHIKPRLLGHWGTCPGIIMVYAHLNRIIRKTGLNALFVVGPGTASTRPRKHSPLTILYQGMEHPLFFRVFGSKTLSVPFSQNTHVNIADSKSLSRLSVFLADSRGSWPFR